MNTWIFRGIVTSVEDGQYGCKILLREINTRAQKPNTIQVECGSRAEEAYAVARTLREGTPVVVTGYLRGNEHNGRVYTNVSVRTIDRLDTGEVEADDNQVGRVGDTQPPRGAQQTLGEDDIPF